MNKPLTAADLAELQRMLTENGEGAAEDTQRAGEESQGLGLFVRRSSVSIARQRKRPWPDLS